VLEFKTNFAGATIYSYDSTKGTNGFLGDTTFSAGVNGIQAWSSNYVLPGVNVAIVAQRLLRRLGGKLRERGFLDLAVPNTRGTNANTFVCAFYDSMDTLQVQIPAPRGNVVRVADFMAELGSAAADITNF